MDDVKDKFKGFMKKVSSSSSGKFKGQGRVLGSSASGPTNPTSARPNQHPLASKLESNLSTRPNPRLNLSNNIQNYSKDELNSSTRPKSTPPTQAAPTSSGGKSDSFDPFDSYITSGKRAPNGVSPILFECPVCGSSYRTEDEVSEHIESCLSSKVENADVVGGLPNEQSSIDCRSESEGRVADYMLAKPPSGSVEVMLRLLRNMVKEPSNEKFRRIRMSNPKIKEAVCEVAGGVELLEFVGFRLQEEGGEMWAVMESSSEEQIHLIQEVLALLEPPQKIKNSSSVVPQKDETAVERSIEQKKIDRQVRVFFSVPENVAAKIELPDSFYHLSAQELKREAELRRKKIEDSQLLIPKSYKEKQAKAARKRYKASLIRIQFPDGVVLQGVFLPWEPTTALYEFVSAALKEPSLEFELLQPALPKRRVVPRFPGAGGKPPTLDDEDLVPSALIKFKPIETDDVVFTGLCNELLQVSEPLTAATTTVVPP